MLLVGHQLLVQPREPSGAVVSWLEVPVDMVENANQVRDPQLGQPLMASNDL